MSNTIDMSTQDTEILTPEQEEDLAKRQAQIDQAAFQAMLSRYAEAGYGFRIVGKNPRVKVYMTHLTKYLKQNKVKIGVFKSKKAAHRKISLICNPKPKKELVQYAS